MKRFIFIAGALTALAACTTGDLANAVAPTPSTFANRTVLDEKAATAVELGYQAFTLAVGTAIQLHKFSPTQLTALSNTDNKIYTAVQAARAAYNAGNATDYNVAIQQANAAIAIGVQELKK